MTKSTWELICPTYRQDFLPARDHHRSSGEKMPEAKPKAGLGIGLNAPDRFAQALLACSGEGSAAAV
jgi:hypothetical protein